MGNFISHHKLMFGLIYLAVPIMLGWIGYLVFDADRSKQELGGATAMSNHTALYELPRVKLSMDSGIGGHGTMKLDIGIEVERNQLKRIQDFEPRIIEKIFMFMHKQDYAKLREPDSARWVRSGLEEEITTGANPINIASVVVNRMVFE